jgi:hypothetical protein
MVGFQRQRHQRKHWLSPRSRRRARLSAQAQRRRREHQGRPQRPERDLPGHQLRRLERPPVLVAFKFLLEVFLCEASLFGAAAVHARVQVVLLAALLRGFAALVFAAFLTAAGTRLDTAAFALLAPAFTAVSAKAPQL